jgi:AcrR family transcriptional regulator
LSEKLITTKTPTNNRTTMPKVIPEYKEAAKDRIIKAAFKIFTKKGYHATTMDDIAKEIGVSKAALYQYFKNKKEILNEIVHSYHTMFREVLRASFEKQSSQAMTEEGSHALLKKYRLHHEMLFELIAIAGHDEEIKQSLKTEYEKDVKLLEEFMNKLMADGKISLKIPANTLAQLYVALYIGMAMKVIMGDDSVEIHRVWSNAIAAMISEKNKTD